MHKREEVIRFIGEYYDKAREKYNLTGDHYFNKDKLKDLSDRDLKYALGRIIILTMFPKEYSNIFVAPHKRLDVIINWRELDYDFIDGKLYGKLRLECNNGLYYNPHDFIKSFDETADTFKCKTCSYEGESSELNSKEWDGKIYYSCPRCKFFLFAEGVKQRRLREIIIAETNINQIEALLKENGYKKCKDLPTKFEDLDNEDSYIYTIYGKYPKRSISVKTKFFLREAKDIDIVISYSEDTHTWYQMKSRQWGMARVAPSADKSFETFRKELLLILKEKDEEITQLASVEYGICTTCVFKIVKDGNLVCNKCEGYSYYHYTDRCIHPDDIYVHLNEHGGLLIENKVRIT